LDAGKQKVPPDRDLQQRNNKSKPMPYTRTSMKIEGWLPEDSGIFFKKSRPIRQRE
jgi:hypothetical protein